MELEASSTFARGVFFLPFFLSSFLPSVGLEMVFLVVLWSGLGVVHGRSLGGLFVVIDSFHYVVVWHT